MREQLERVELDGFGEDKPLFILLGEHRTATGDAREPCRMQAHVKQHDAYRVVHVMSRPAGGEVRGYILANGVAGLRYPSYPPDWPEVDAAVSAALGARVVL